MTRALTYVRATDTHEMSVLDEIRTELGGQWIPKIYSDKIRTGRTRAINIDIAERENVPTILHTLLGIELKVGKKRFACPDLATARYMRAFARIGCRSFALPYDITEISPIADEIETGWHRMLLILNDKIGAGSERKRKIQRTALIKQIRLDLQKMGAGEIMPRFDQKANSVNG